MSTLSSLAAKTGHIYAQCTRCSHFSLFRTVDLVIKYGDRTRVEDAERRLRCSVCGAQAARFTESRPTANPSMIERFKSPK
jgi:hypothetical protein